MTPNRVALRTFMPKDPGGAGGHGRCPWGGHRRSSAWVRVGRTWSRPERRRDLREDGASRARGEGCGRRSRARDAGLRRRAADGAGGRGRGRRRRASARRRGRRRGAAAASGPGRRARAGSSWRSRGAGRAAVCRASSSRAGPRRRRSWPSSGAGLPARCLHPRRGRPASRAIGGGGASKSRVSRLCAEIDERGGAPLERRIEGRWPRLWLDATRLEAREDGARHRARTDGASMARRRPRRHGGRRGGGRPAALGRALPPAGLRPDRVSVRGGGGNSRRAGGGGRGGHRGVGRRWSLATSPTIERSPR